MVHDEPPDRRCPRARAELGAGPFTATLRDAVPGPRALVRRDPTPVTPKAANKGKSMPRTFFCAISFVGNVATTFVYDRPDTDRDLRQERLLLGSISSPS